MKCDETRPACLICTSAGLACGGYEKNIFFDFEDPPEAGSLRFRRPLLTEKERKSMSEWLTSCVPPRSALRKISQIEEACEEATSSEPLQITYGPFGAFRLIPTTECAGVQSHSVPPVPEPHSDYLDVFTASDEEQYPPDFSLSPGTQQLIQSFIDQPQQNPMSHSFDIWSMPLSTGRIEEILDDATIPDLSPPAFTAPCPQVYSFPPCVPDSQIGHPAFYDAGSLVSNTASAVPHDAVFLLRHYQTTVLRLFTPFRHSKTPWHVLFIPHVKNCLAALTLGDDMDHASLCVFYGTLAISAFSLGGVTQSSEFLNKGKMYKQQAREQIKLMLKTAYEVPKSAKYKSILMALLTMVQISMVTGNRDQTECYFLEAEKFIRLRGLSRKKSRKVRLLHHCYAFERILHESTFVGGTNSSHRQHVRSAIESSGLVVYGQDSGIFRLSSWSNLAEDMMRVKCQEEGENDLHLEYPGFWSATLYPEIFGVPEPWVFLVSFVIRLARAKEAAEQEVATERLSAKEFLHRAKAIEKYINQMQHAPETSEEGHEIGNMLNAMRHALTIYFYRRIYDVDASMLQHKVVSVRDCLISCESSDPEQVFGSARLVWPAFIAASEAEDPEVQASFSYWFKSAAQRSGLRLFSDTLETIERTWQEKGSPHDSGGPWLETAKGGAPSSHL